MPRFSDILRLLTRRTADTQSRSFMAEALTTSFAVHGLGLGLLVMLGYLNVGILDPVVPYPPRRDVASIFVPPSSAEATSLSDADGVRLETAPETPRVDTLQPAAVARPMSDSGSLPVSEAEEASADSAPSSPRIAPELVRARREMPIDDQRQQAVAASGAMSRASIGMDALVTPRVLTNPPAEYPPEALRARIEGKVVLRVGVDASGAVVSAEVKQSSGTRSLDDSALRTVRRWRFLPAINRHAEVRYVNVPFHFVIRQR